MKSNSLTVPATGSRERVQVSKQAKITIRGNEVHHIEYQTLEVLAESIWNLIFRKDSQFNVAIELENGEKVNWQPVSAHYCFAMGKVAVEEFVKEVFEMEATV